jgi:hypothetical protein
VGRSKVIGRLAADNAGGPGRRRACLPALYNLRDLALIGRTVALDTTDDEFGVAGGSYLQQVAG